MKLSLVKRILPALMAAAILCGCSVKAGDLDVVIQKGAPVSADSSETLPEETVPDETTSEPQTAETVPETEASPETTAVPETTPAPETTPEPTTTPAPATTPAPTTTPAPATTPAPTTAPAPTTTPAPETTTAAATTEAKKEPTGFWVALKLDSMEMGNGESATVSAALGTSLSSIESVQIDVDADDFLVSKSCPDSMTIDGEKYKAEDYTVAEGIGNGGAVSFDSLPFKFDIKLERRNDRDMFFGEARVKTYVTVSGGAASAECVLYYYGDRNNICFSTKSFEDAQERYDSLGTAGQ